MWIHEANKIKVQEPRLSIGDTSLPLFMLEKTDVRPRLAYHVSPSHINHETDKSATVSSVSLKNS